jgi:hypothetical protein
MALSGQIFCCKPGPSSICLAWKSIMRRRNAQAHGLTNKD